jgi:protein O-GlcNAc transferase
VVNKRTRHGKSGGSGHGPEALYEAAERAKKAGKSDQAARHLRKLLSRHPEESKAHFLLGNLHRQSGEHKQALRCYDNALSFDPENLAVQLNRANALQDLGMLQKAETAYIGVLGKQPGLAVAQFNFGLLEQRLEKHDEAVIAFHQAVKLDPGLEKGHRQLVNTLVDQGRSAEAATALEGLLAVSPGDVEVLLELGELLKKNGAYERSERAYRSVIAQEPDQAQAHYNLGSVLQIQAKYSEAIKAYAAALEIDPNLAPAYVSLGNCLHQTGDIDGAVGKYRAAMDRDPSLAHARLGYCISQLPIVYHSEKDIEERREKYSRALTELHEYYRAAGGEERSRAASAVGFLQPFYLAYQGLPVKDLQQLYAKTVRLLMTARFPEFDQVISMPAVKDKIRLGIVSGFFRNHSAWNYFQGMFEAIDRSKFEIILFYTRNEVDRETRLLESISDGFIKGPMDAEQWARTIRHQNLHVLFHPEFGMDPMGVQLGCLRLAPIQLTSWGHPVTSGLETIDYYLSSELMEPENAQDEYTEQLVRLPMLSMHYRLPTVDPEPLTRADMGLPDDGIMYWCCQSLFKYMPRHDDVFPRIAQKLDKAFFVFLAGHGGPVEQRLKKRLAAAFAERGLDMETHCYFLPRLAKPVFAAVSSMADVFLDSVDWSGCNSTMEAIGFDRPIITLPGQFMRGRHTSAFLQMMGLEEWIADSKDDYIAMAVRLGKDEPLRRSVSQMVRRRKHRLYRNTEPVRALEEFLTQTVSAYEPRAPSADRSRGLLHHLQRKVDESPEDSAAHWALACRFQRDNDFEAALAYFCRSLELQNPRYAEAEPLPARPPDNRATFDNGYVEFAGLKYPKIPVLETTRHRPFWSVVIPACNRDLYLLECLASVLAQWRGSQHMEIIVIDNGSQPSLKHHVDAIGRGIVRYHRHPETIPLQRNWNSAVNAARGYWVHLLHDDDYVLPGFYEALENGLESAPQNVGAAFTAYENINENEEVVFRNRVLGAQRGVAKHWDRVIGVNNVLNPPAVVISRDAYESVGGYSDEILFTTDWELYMRLASQYQWWYEPRIRVRYRQHSQNVTAEQLKAGAQGEAFWRAIEMSNRYLPESIRKGTVARARRYHFLWALQRLSLPLQAGNTQGSLLLMREMLRIDRSDDSINDLFDWLGTTLAKPMWPAIMEAMSRLPEGLEVPPRESTGQVFDWLSSAQAGGIRAALTEIIVADDTWADSIKPEFVQV